MIVSSSTDTLAVDRFYRYAREMRLSTDSGALASRFGRKPPSEFLAIVGVVFGNGAYT